MTELIHPPNFSIVSLLCKHILVACVFAVDECAAHFVSRFYIFHEMKRCTNMSSSCFCKQFMHSVCGAMNRIVSSRKYMSQTRKPNRIMWHNSVEFGQLTSLDFSIDFFTHLIYRWFILWKWAKELHQIQRNLRATTSKYEEKKRKSKKKKTQLIWSNLWSKVCTIYLW